MSKYFSILRINWIHSLEYRANALIGLFAILSGLFIEYQIWTLIFSENNHAVIAMEGVESGYSFKQLIVFIFLSIIVGQLKSSWVTSSQMILEIRQGLINKYLIRPVSYFWYHFMMFIGFNSLYYIVYSVILLAFTFIFPNMIFQTLPALLFNSDHMPQKIRSPELTNVLTYYKAKQPEFSVNSEFYKIIASSSKKFI